MRVQFWIVFICSINIFLIKTDASSDVPPPDESCLETELGIGCGYPYGLAYSFGQINGEDVSMYLMNDTASNLEKKGAKIDNIHMFYDAIYNFTYTNGEARGSMGFESVVAVAPAGGIPAIKERAYFMALLGSRIDGITTWHCDAVLINREWVLSAAHCMVSRSVIINVIRLGELDWSKEPQGHYDNHPMDFHIDNVIYHPQYSPRNGYYDLVLLKIQGKIPAFQHSANPICLPWGSETSRRHVGSSLVLSGWGATKFQGEKTPRLQQVDLLVMDTKVCNTSYSKLRSFRRKYPNGLTHEDTLCAGSPQGGKDACKGDSGGPLVYQDSRDNFILGGIVSGGHGCGLKEFPGLYIPINNARILQWIKSNAFREC